jgi:hypothetical protein
MQKEKVAGWSMASSFVNSQIGIKPDQSLSGFSFNHRRARANADLTFCACLAISSQMQIAV